ncbi:hypothetical protein ES703_117711 [subsurface metagenome]
MFVDHDSEEWIITESIGKGTAITRFSYPRAYIYRIKGVEVKAKDVISVHSHYGEWRYDWDVPLKTALWWLLKHYFGKVIPRWRDKEVNCQEWVCLLAIELGVRVIPEDEYPMCVNLEHSPNLEYLGETDEACHLYPRFVGESPVQRHAEERAQRNVDQRPAGFI